MFDYDRFPARPQWYRGVKMRSNAEVDYAKWLDRWDADYTYERWAFRHPTTDLEWRWDFMIEDVATTWTKFPVPVFVEVKPELWLEQASAGQRHLMLSKMAIVFDYDPDAVVILEQFGAPRLPRIIRFGAAGVTPQAFRGAWIEGSAAAPVLAMLNGTAWGKAPASAPPGPDHQGQLRFAA